MVLTCCYYTLQCWIPPDRPVLQWQTGIHRAEQNQLSLTMSLGRPHGGNTAFRIPLQPPMDMHTGGERTRETHQHAAHCWLSGMKERNHTSSAAGVNTDVFMVFMSEQGGASLKPLLIM
ncbi:hypothetical protein EYF80_066691 [Liparis tanakae]|uniref:Uncharacterized protein n=1 Tax=Liparis tanakae TaxID=230148 RepID=A0A4Z2E3A4_9TELE|nr:hypothetical protein EYF80_066691 [Liparis tanakae]